MGHKSVEIGDMPWTLSLCQSWLVGEEAMLLVFNWFLMNMVKR
jgi:hypothetical protein